MARFAQFGAVAAVTMIMQANLAPAEEISLIFATTNVPNIHVNVQVMHPWAKRVNEQGKGVVKIDVRDGFTLANHTNFYTRALDDVVQITWGIQSQVGGKFPRSHVVGLPYLIDKAEHAAVAYWRLYKSGLLDAEYDEIVPLFFCVIPHAAVHTSKPLPSLDNLRGLKLTMNSKIVSDAITRLGATPISLPLPDFYEGIRRGTVDGAVIPWTAVPPFKLHEVTSYHVDVPLGNSIGVLFMAKKRFEALPAAARKVLMDNAGEQESRSCGAFWDKVSGEGRNMVKALGAKHTIVTLNPEQSANWRRQVEPVIAQWAKETRDGDRVLAKYRELLAQVKASGTPR
jgi:TRAP-type C4-dicarboxylate transport system substrate-binding protein